MAGGTLKVRHPVSGLWEPISTAGPAGQRGPRGFPGPEGPQGPMGVSSIIVGDFGIQTTPADLPPDGLIPVDWDGPGVPATAYQMVIGQSLYYDKPTDPLDGHLFQFITTAIDPSGWLDVGLLQGPEGPGGDDGPPGPPGDEVYVGTEDPTPAIKPTALLWYDTDDDRILGPVDLPLGGVTGAPLVKSTDLDGDVVWDDGTAGEVLMTDGRNPMQSNALIRFQSQEGDKILLYGNGVAAGGASNFGLGIDASTLSLFAGGNVSFRLNSHDGDRWGYVDGTGFHTDESVVAGNGMVSDNGTAYLADSSVNAAPVRWLTNRSRSSGGQWLADFFTNWYSTWNGVEEVNFEIVVSAGGFTSRAFIFKTDGNLEIPGGPVVADVTVRAAESKQRDASALDADVAGRLIDRLQPITFERVDPVSGDGPDLPPDPVREVGFALSDLEGSELEERLVRRGKSGADDDPDGDGYSLVGILAAAVAEIKSLRERVAQLEGGAP